MEKLNFEIVTKELTIPSIVEVKDGRRDYVTYGEDNLFPQYIWQLFTHSAIFESIIRGTSDYVMGNDIIISDSISSFSSKVNKDYNTLADIIEKAIFDFLLYDGFAIQVFRDSNDNINELYNLDFQNCRISKDEKRVIYCSDWSKYNAKTSSYPMFDADKPVKNSIFYFKGKTAPQTNTYPIPSYIGALSDIRTSTEISNFHLNSVINGFNASAIVNFNNGSVDEETAKMVEKKFQNKFCGSDNASKFLLAFNENKESSVTIERLQSDDYADRYNVLENTITNNIFVAFRCQPQLFGLRSEGNMFNHDEYIQAAALYNKTVIKPIQKMLERAFSRLLRTEDAIKFIPFNLDDETNIGE